MTLVGGTAPLVTVCAERRSSGARPWWGERTLPTCSVWCAAGGAAAGLLLAVVTRQAMPDDALIHASYARNLVERGEWGLVPGVPANTATSPLWVWLLAASALMTGSVLFGGAVLLVVCLSAIALGLSRIGGSFAAALGTVLIASAPVMSSAVGMETFLAAALLIWLVERMLVTDPVHRPSTALIVGALILTRPDLAATAAVVGLVAMGASGSRRPLGTIVLGGLVAAPWFVFSWIRFGSAWPDTVPLKGTMPGWGNGSIHLLGSVPLYAASWPAATWLTVGLLVVGALATPVAIERRAWPAVALAAGGVADLAFVAMGAGPPASYYAAPAAVALGLAGVLVGVEGRTGWMPVAGLVLIAVLFSCQFAGWSAGFAPLRTNWASNAQYAAIADGLPRDGLVLNRGEIGALAFFCLDRGCRVADDLLADPHATDRYVDAWRSENPWAAMNYRFRGMHPPLPFQYVINYGEGPKLGTHPLASWPVTGGGGRTRLAVLTRVPEGLPGTPG